MEKEKSKVSEMLDEYNEILNKLSKDLNNEDSVLAFLKALEELIFLILKMYLSKYSFVKGLNFQEVAQQLALEYFIEVKKGKEIKLWSFYLKKNLLRKIQENFKDPRITQNSIRIEEMANKYLEIEESDESEELKRITQMISILYPELTKAEIKILIALALEKKMNVFLSFKGFKDKERAKAVFTLLKYIHYLRRFNMIIETDKTDSNYILRALAGVTISPLFLVLDVESMAKIIATLGGQTVRIPTFDEMKKLIPLLILFYDYKLKGETIEEISKKLNLNTKDVKLLLSLVDKVKFSDLERKNLLIALGKFIDLAKTQDSFISQRLSELEEKMMKNSESFLKLYRSLLREEAKGVEDLLKLTKEIVEKLT